MSRIVSDEKLVTVYLLSMKGLQLDFGHFVVIITICHIYWCAHAQSIFYNYTIN